MRRRWRKLRQSSRRLTLAALTLALVITYLSFAQVGSFPRTLYRSILFVVATIKEAAGFFPDPLPVESLTEIGLVERVIDGDTIVLQTGEHVRYLGLDTPELGSEAGPAECYAEEAKQKNSQLTSGMEVVLVRDTENTDAYGRLLRYVYVEGTFINLELIKQGFARVQRISPNTLYARTFSAAQREAQKQGRGLWSACAQ